MDYDFWKLQYPPYYDEPEDEEMLDEELDYDDEDFMEDELGDWDEDDADDSGDDLMVFEQLKFNARDYQFYKQAVLDRAVGVDTPESLVAEMCKQWLEGRS